MPDIFRDSSYLRFDAHNILSHIASKDLKSACSMSSAHAHYYRGYKFKTLRTDAQGND